MTPKEAMQLLFDGKLSNTKDGVPTRRELSDKVDEAKYRIDEAFKVLMVHFGREKQEVYDNPCSRCGGVKREYDAASVCSGGPFKQIDCLRCHGSGVDPLPAI